MKTTGRKRRMNATTLWKGVVNELQARKPITGAYAAQGEMLGMHRGVMVVGFPGGRSLALECLKRPLALAAVEEVASTLYGEPVSLEFVVKPKAASNEPAEWVRRAS